VSHYRLLRSAALHRVSTIAAAGAAAAGDAAAADSVQYHHSQLAAAEKPVGVSVHGLFLGLNTDPMRHRLLSPLAKWEAQHFCTKLAYI
jgi:hypothetical protein